MRQFFIPYLTFENSMETATYYKEIFDGEITYIMYGKDTPNCPEDKLNEIMHLELKIKDNYLYFADGDAKNTGQNILLLDYLDLNEMTEQYKRMKEESEVLQELHDTFWGAVFGVLKDKYGFTWEFHYSKNRGE